MLPFQVIYRCIRRPVEQQIEEVEQAKRSTKTREY